MVTMKDKVEERRERGTTESTFAGQKGRRYGKNHQRQRQNPGSPMS
jgi:hypothetical protein